MAAGKKTGGGSRKGRPNKTTTALKEMILGALAEQPGGGQKYLADQAVNNPTAFMTLLGKVLPTTLAGDPNAPIVHKNSVEERRAAARRLIDDAFRELGDGNDIGGMRYGENSRQPEGKRHRGLLTKSAHT